MDFYNALCVKKEISAFLCNGGKRGKSVMASNKGSRKNTQNRGSFHGGDTCGKAI